MSKDIMSARRCRIGPNSSIVSNQKRKNCSTQTANYAFMENSSQFFIADGKISKNDQNIYKKAIDFVNKWNIAMNEYLKKNRTNKKQDCFEFDENFNIAPLPNYMAFFVSIVELDGEYIGKILSREIRLSLNQALFSSDNSPFDRKISFLQYLFSICLLGRLLDSKKPSRKNCYTQTSATLEKSKADVKSQTQYVRFAEETTENYNDSENLARNIQQTQYGSYTKSKNFQKSQNLNQCPPLKRSARVSESNIRQTNSNVVYGVTARHNTSVTGKYFFFFLIYMP